MSTISVRKLDSETLRRLRLLAARNGVSMEEEVRQILKRAVNAPEKLGDLAKKMFGADNGVDLELSEREIYEPVDLSK